MCRDVTKDELGGEPVPRVPGSPLSGMSFQSIIEAAPDGIVISRAGNILYANFAAARLLGYAAPAELVGLSMATFLDGESLELMRARIVATQRTGVPLGPQEYPARRRDGSSAVAEITSLPIEYDGAPAVLAFARDVTERASLRSRLERADKLAAIGRLAAGVAHEVNNPLTYVSLGLESLTRKLENAVPEGAPREDAMAVLEQLLHGVDRVARIVRDLRAFARSEAERKRLVSLADVADAAVRMVAHEVRPRAELVVEMDDVPPVLADSGRLEQVFVNLLLNAAQALEEGSPGRVVALRGRKKGEDRVVITVSDNGPGIPLEVLDRIFEPFFTTKASGMGTGLGLSICESIVKEHGGEITARSTEGGGTTFEVELPVASPQARPNVEPPPAPKPARAVLDRGASVRILVIDDEAPVGTTLKTLLGDHHEVAVETDPGAGVARLLHERFDVVLCDVMMPGLSGMDVFERVTRQDPSLAGRFLFITGGAFTPRAAAFLAETTSPHLQKPFSLATVERAIQAIVERVGAASGGSVA